MSYEQLDEESLQILFTWIDQIPLSRKKKNLTRDFSDGLLAAEIVKDFFPRMVEIHNYRNANSVNQKLSNWSTLSRKVLSKLDYSVPVDVFKKIAECQPGLAEVFLFGLWKKIENYIAKQNNKTNQNFSPEERLYYDTRQSNKASTTAASDVDRVQLPPKQGGGGGGSAHSTETDYTIKNPIPLAQLDLSTLDNQTRLILEEKEQALLASQETVQILQVKIRRLEHLLHLKDLRIEDMESRGAGRFGALPSTQSNRTLQYPPQ